MKNRISIQVFCFISLQVLMFAGCGSSEAAVSEAEWLDLENTVAERSFSFSANRAETYGSVPESLVDTPGYLNMDKDQVDFSLRYFGSLERAVPGSPGGLYFKGLIRDFQMIRNDKDRALELIFSVEKSNAETLQCDLRIFPGNKATLAISSNMRSRALYYGEIE